MLPAREETLIHFCAHLPGTLHHSSIKVYLSAVRSLHIEEGLPDPLIRCLQMQRVLRGIRRHQGLNQLKRQPITSDLMLIIHHSLDFSTHNHVMLWAACCVGFLVSFELASLLSTLLLIQPFISQSMTSKLTHCLIPTASESTLNAQRRTLSPALFYLHWCWQARHLHYACSSSIFASPWLCSGPTFSPLRRHFFKPPMVDIFNQVHFLLGWSPWLFNGSQLRYWSGHLNSLSRRRVPDHLINPWSMVK